MPDRTEANPNELNQDDARYGFRCCHLKNIWTAPLPPETELSRQMTDRKSGSAGMPRPISYAVFCLKKKNVKTGGPIKQVTLSGIPQAIPYGEVLFEYVH